jgi:hypothetical protein
MLAGGIIRRHEGRRKKAMNMSKKTDESPSQFYEQLCEDFCQHTPFDPEAAENQWLINGAFVSQAQEDIRQKLQKLEGSADMNASWLLEVAIRVFVNQDQEAKWEADR